ncbi:unnamed protein product [Lactuca saligna]|uniref:Uncharacterized protein n=1 Tax=Lactuca saligna TaxID=75948 RepID=A0AA36EMY1_LACSI|nr:unnamed protein product [Lactuca saligna]
MNQPEYEAKIQIRVGPSQGAIQNSNYILANIEYEPKPHGMKEIGTKSTEVRGRVQILLLRMPSYGRKLVGAPDALNSIPSDSGGCKIDTRARENGGHFHQTTGRHFSWFHLTMHQEERGVQESPEHAQQNPPLLGWASLAETRRNLSLSRQTCSS